MANLISQQFEFLGARRTRPASALGPGAAADDPAWPRFETVELCQHEDRTRAAALRQLDESLLPEGIDANSDWLPERRADELATLLEDIADLNRSYPAPPCLASTTYMRDRRIGVLGAVLELVATHPDLERAWFTGHHPALRFTTNGRGSRIAEEALSRLNAQLQVSGASASPGFLIAFLNGYLALGHEQFRLEYRGLVLGDKLAALKQTPRFNSLPSPDRGLRINLHRIASLQRQITKMMPSVLRERVGGGAAKPRSRMREPYHSLYLLWLARRHLADLIVVDGAFYWNGGLKLRECYGDPASPHAIAPAAITRRAIVAQTDRRSASSVAQQSQTDPREIQHNRSIKRARRRVIAIFPNPTPVLKRRDDVRPHR